MLANITIIDFMRDLIFLIGSTVCHQLTERSISIDGNFLPVCARCTGIYFSIFLSSFILFIRGRLKGNKIFSIPQTLILCLCLIPFMVDGAGSYLRIWNTNNFIRILTGAFAGFALPFFIILIFNFNVDGVNQKIILKDTKEEFFILNLCLICAMLIYYQFFNFKIISIILSFGIILLYVHIIALIIKLIFSKMSNIKLYSISLILAIFLMFIVLLIKNNFGVIL